LLRKCEKQLKGPSIWRLKGVGDKSGVELPQHDSTYHSLGFLHINLVSQHHKREVLRIVRRGLDQKLVPPTIKGFETLARVDVVYEDTAVGSSVEGNTEGWETFGTGGIPERGR